MQTYNIYCNADEDRQYMKTPLDGDMHKVGPEGLDFTKPPHSLKIDEGGRIRQNDTNAGVRVDPTHLPTKIQMGGRRRKLDDVQYTLSTFFVSEKFRQVMESLEPGKHQFEKVDLLWKDGSAASDQQYYWFFVLQRLDSIDHEKTTHEFNGMSWKWIKGGKYVVSAKSVGNNVIWREMFIGFNYPHITKKFKEAMDMAGVTGIGYHTFNECGE